MKLETASIIITGAAAGFGREMTRFFSSRGSKIYAVDINKEELLKLKKENAGEIHIFECDVSKHLDVETIIDDIFQIDKSINVLINNAGIMKNAPLVNLLNRSDSKHSVELWQEIIGVNQNGVFYMTRAVVDKMIRNRNKGVVINISSIAANGNAGQTAYSATKAAVEAMSKVWAKELGVFGIRSVCIAPGFMNTLGTHDALEEKMLSQWISKTPLKRTGEISEIVSTIEFVIKNDFFNGETLSVNGGLVI